MSCKKGKFPYSFFIFRLNYMNAQPSNLLLNGALFSKSPHFAAQIKMKHVAMEGFLKRHRNVSMAIEISKMEIFLVLVNGSQPLTNFTKKPNIGAMGVPNAPLEYYNVF